MNTDRASRRHFCFALAAATLLPRELFAVTDTEVLVAEMDRSAPV
jgi:hypothetical protein